MAIVSRNCQNAFNPTPHGDDFNSRISRIITPNASATSDGLPGTTRPARSNTPAGEVIAHRVNLYTPLDFADRRRSSTANSNARSSTALGGRGSAASTAPGQEEQFASKMKGQYEEEIAKYYYWVDASGNPLQEIPQVDPEEERVRIQPRPDTPEDVKRERIEASKVRSQAIWKKVNPGYVKQLYKTPVTTYQQQHKWDEKNEAAQKEKSWDYHLCKTDFSGYIEEDARQQQFAKRQAS